jgi:ribose transport system substrate-binding protein
MGSILHGHGTVAVLGETPALMSTVARDEAFRRSMAARYPGITVLDPMPGRFRTNLPEQDTENLLASHPDLNAIFTLTVGATRGVYRGLKLEGRIHQVHLVACDQDLDLLYYLAGRDRFSGGREHLCDGLSGDAADHGASRRRDAGSGLALCTAFW